MREGLPETGVVLGLGGTELHGLVQCTVQASLRPKLSARPGVRESSVSSSIFSAGDKEPSR